DRQTASADVASVISRSRSLLTPQNTPLQSHTVTPTPHYDPHNGPPRLAHYCLFALALSHRPRRHKRPLLAAGRLRCSGHRLCSTDHYGGTFSKHCIGRFRRYSWNILESTHKRPEHGAQAPAEDCHLLGLRPRCPQSHRRVPHHRESPVCIYIGVSCLHTCRSTHIDSTWSLTFGLHTEAATPTRYVITCLLPRAQPCPHP
ncbi:uncharacterized protein EV422DRAFT_619627, partial [Fimicolochytrium jonesii]|uniref:uncharacterized protein n=1 Tax=Fimicolochytrium jonesii TaxID=1396493 RepID=UPI0022FE6378